MTVVLDSGGLSAVASSDARLAWLRTFGVWPPVIPSVVLAESLTGDHRRDHATNRVITLAKIVDVDERVARVAARLRTASSRSRTSAVDAIVVAVAAGLDEPHVLTSDPEDIAALAEHAARRIEVGRT